MDDNFLAQKIHKYFHDNGVNACISADIKTGDDFFNVIRTRLMKSKEMCLIYSKNILTSDWVKAEKATFWALQRKINPVLTYDMEFDTLDFFLKTTNSIKLDMPKDDNDDLYYKNALDKLIADIKDRRSEDQLDIFERDFE